MGKMSIRQNKTAQIILCAAFTVLFGVFLWLRGMYFLGEFLAICWGWIR